jgi:hypothetical protein
VTDNTQKEDFRQLLEIYDECYAGVDCLDVPSHVITITRQSWDAMTESDRRTMFSKYSVHVVGPSPNNPLHMFKEWKDFHTTRIDMTVERHVHDQGLSDDVTQRTCRATINNYIELVESNSGQVVNYLDIDMSGLRVTLPNDGLEDGENLGSLTQRSVVWRTHWPSRHLSWGLLGKKSSITRSHMDAGGFCTRVRVCKGKKLWMMALNQKLPTEQGFTNHVPWQAVVLSEGDDL